MTVRIKHTLNAPTHHAQIPSSSITNQPTPPFPCRASALVPSLTSLTKKGTSESGMQSQKQKRTGFRSSLRLCGEPSSIPSLTSLKPLPRLPSRLRAKTQPTHYLPPPTRKITTAKSAHRSTSDATSIHSSVVCNPPPRTPSVSSVASPAA